MGDRRGEGKKVRGKGKKQNRRLRKKGAEKKRMIKKLNGWRNERREEEKNKDWSTEGEEK